MLNLLSGMDQTCEGLSRRSFLQVGTLGGLGLSLPTLLARQSAGSDVPSDVNCILIWTRHRHGRSRSSVHGDCSESGERAESICRTPRLESPERKSWFC
jgi:hypothetical protein